MFQLQALNTQFQGTLKKRDKELDRLQQLLSKVVKDSQVKTQQQSATSKDSQKTCSGASKGFSISFVTLPLKKNLSQVAVIVILVP